MAHFFLDRVLRSFFQNCCQLQFLHYWFQAGVESAGDIILRHEHEAVRHIFKNPIKRSTETKNSTSKRML